MMGQVTENDNRNTILISAESYEEADKLFHGLSASVSSLPALIQLLFLHCEGFFAIL